jgi:hypothetical protein
LTKIKEIFVAQLPLDVVSQFDLASALPHRHASMAQRRAKQEAASRLKIDEEISCNAGGRDMRNAGYFAGASR